MKKLKMYLVLYREKKNKIKVNKNKRKCDELMFYGENLEAIRLLNNKSRSDIARDLRVDERRIWQYETGQLTPNLGEVFNLACIFNVQTQYFYAESPMIGQLGLVKKGSIFYSYKESEYIKPREIDPQYYEANTFSTISQFILSYCSFPETVLKKIIIEIDKTRLKETSREDFIKQAANIARSYITNAEFNEDLLLDFEKAGVMVYERSSLDIVKSYSFWDLAGHPHIIMCNLKRVVGNQNLDLAYELGYLLLNRHAELTMASGDDFERLNRNAFDFTRHFLLPQSELIKECQPYKRITWRVWEKIAHKWKVPVSLVTLHARKAGIISYKQYCYYEGKIHDGTLSSKKQPPSECAIKIRCLLKDMVRKNIISSTYLFNYFKIENAFLKRLISIDLTRYDNKPTPVNSNVINYKALVQK
ncbi:hypothetical protein HCH16_04180 [Staphylococcus pettenkoferi]|uniref:helix-turn-helix domain-containing protein n=1 Tax=Staphylococcus pettenkoferi TaxID=170573 RepID=UPI001C8CE8E0|nr:helix-turn-helix transcriptional regulator [Staphylococcus pettenkoferi]MBX8993122.1 hypothetical protein [Staphylococcus pettenkoferi]